MIIAQDAELREVCDRIRESGRVALDTEFIGEQSYRPKVFLAQVAAPGVLAVIDPLALNDLTPLWELVTDPQVTIITHAGRHDFAACYHWTQRPPTGVFDTQLAAGLVGVGYPLSYAALVKAILGVRIRKLETLTDWSRRPLHPKQIEYALEDVHHLLPLYDSLSARLEEMNRRAWAEEEFAALQDERLYRIKPDELYQRIKGAGRLKPRQLAILRALAAWREEEARRRDRPARSIVADHFLLEMARRQPRTWQDITAIRGARRRLAKAYADDLLAAVAEAIALPDDQLPPPLSRPTQETDCKVAVDLASAMVTHLAHTHQVAPELLATRRELERYFRWRVGVVDEPPASSSTGWRRPLLAEPLDALYAGRVHLAVHRAGRNLRLDVHSSSNRNEWAAG